METESYMDSVLLPANYSWFLMRTQPTKLDVTIYWSQQARREVNTEAREM